MKNETVQRYFVFHKVLFYGLTVWGIVVIMLLLSVGNYKQGIDLKVRKVAMGILIEE